MCDWFFLFKKQLSVSYFLDFSLPHDAFKTLNTDILD